LVRKPEVKIPFGNLGEEGAIILKWMTNTYEVMTGLIWLRTWTSGGLL
jgi:hypothetical protein